MEDAQKYSPWNTKNTRFPNSEVRIQSFSQYPTKCLSFKHQERLQLTTKEPKKNQDEFYANSTKNLTKNKDFFHVGIVVTAKKRGPKCLSSTDPLFFYAEFLRWGSH